MNKNETNNMYVIIVDYKFYKETIYADDDDYYFVKLVRNINEAKIYTSLEECKMECEFLNSIENNSDFYGEDIIKEMKEGNKL